MLWEKYVEQHYFGAFPLMPDFDLFFNFVLPVAGRLFFYLMGADGFLPPF